MRKKVCQLMIAAALMITSACGAVNEKETATAPEAVPDAQTDKANPKASGGNMMPRKTEPPAVKPKPKPAKTKIVPLYRMNDAYRFIPISEEAPKKAVLLTFDDGPKEKDLLISLLNTLERHQAKAIYFVNGYRIKQNPELLKLIHERGQTIGNHSWDHIDLKKEKPDKIAKQISDVQQIVEKLTGQNPLFFRPPFGSGGNAVKDYVKKEGMLYMTWSNGSLDWDKSTKDKPDLVIKNVLDQLHPGANILMHELPWTAEALDELLTALERKGYGFIDPATIQTVSKNGSAK